MLHTLYHQLKYSSPNRSKQKTTAQKKSLYLSGKGGLWKRWSGEWVKSRKRQDRQSDKTTQKNKWGDREKWDQTIRIAGLSSAESFTYAHVILMNVAYIQ